MVVEEGALLLGKGEEEAREGIFSEWEVGWKVEWEGELMEPVVEVVEIGVWEGNAIEFVGFGEGSSWNLVGV